MNTTLSRRNIVTGLAVSFIAAGCDRLPRVSAKSRDQSASSSCAAHSPTARRRVAVVIDSTTVLDVATRTEVARRVLDAARRHGGAWSVALFGGRDAALLRQTAQVALADPAEVERSRWRDSPAARARAGRCQDQQFQALELAVRAGLSQVDAGPDGYSPVIEAVTETLQGRDAAQRMTLIVVSDGIQNVPGRTFYGARGVGLHLPSGDRLAKDLQREGRIPDARNVDVVHVALGWDGKERAAIRPPSETMGLDRAWRGVWVSAGAASVTIGHPLPMLPLMS